MRPEIILAFDTSAAHCAAALLWGNKVFLANEPMDKGQAERLLPLLEELLSKAGLNWRDITRLGVGTGPGNFTGVRISVAAARGLALGLGIPAIGVSRLEALAHGLPRPITVVEDARRDEVYVQTFADDGASPAILAARGEIGGLAANVTGCAIDGLPSAMPIARAIAEIAALRMPPFARPAPFYLRGADAAPPSDPPPVILP